MKKPVKPMNGSNHIRGYFDSARMVEPTGVLYWANTKEYDLPKSQNCYVEADCRPGVASPDISAVQSSLPRSSSVWCRKRLRMRTLLDRILADPGAEWGQPASSMTCELNLDDLTGLILDKAPDLVKAVFAAYEGGGSRGIKDAADVLLNALYDDFKQTLSDPRVTTSWSNTSPRNMERISSNTNW